MKILLLYLSCLLALAACSTKQQAPTGLLWEITSPDGKQAYLFGTMHLYPEGRIAIPEAALAALRNCTVLATEHNVRDAENQRLFRQHNLDQLGAKANRLVAQQYGSSLKSMEGQLMQVADNRRIPITGLESAREVVELLNNVTIPLDNQTDEEILAQHEQVIRLYNSGNIDSLANELLDKELGNETRRLLVDQRNRNWLDDIERLVRQEKAFIAVGMGHLGGANGLINLLRRRGYSVEKM